MKNKRTTAFLSVICLLLTLLCPLATAADYSDYTLPAPSLSASGAVVMELDGGRVLYGKNENSVMHPASLTKIMTVLLVVEAVERGDVSLDDKVTVGSDYNQGVPPYTSSVTFSVGEKLTLRDLLHCAMLSSVNESCNVMAVHVSGSIEGFVGRMNKRAEELGCVNTRFENTNGLTLPGHYTTAYDLALIAREALSHDLFAQLCGTEYYTVPATNMSGERYLNNTNALICQDSVYGSRYLYPGAFGVKTGHTDAAGYCLAGAAEKNGIRILTIVLGCQQTSSGYGNFSDTIHLLDWAFNNFSVRTVIEKGKKMGTAPVKNGVDADSVELVTAESVRSFLPEGLDISNYQTVIKLDDEELEAPIEKGDRLGTVTVLDANGELCGTVELVAAADVGASVWASIVGEISDFFSRSWMTLVAVLITLLLLLYFVLKIRAQYRRKKAEEQRRRRMAQKRREESRRREKEAQRKYYESFFEDENGGNGRR